MSGQSQIVLPVRDAVFDLLRARAILQDVTVLRREPKQIASDIEAALASLKLCLFVFPALLLEPNANGNPGPYFERIQIRVQCIENPVLNDTTCDVYQLVEHVHWILNGVTLTGVEAVKSASLFPGKPATVEVDDPSYNVFDVIYETQGGLTPRPDSP